MAEIREIDIEPITFGQGLQLNEFDKARIQGAIKKGLADLPISQNWTPKKSTSKASANENRGKLVIEISKYGSEIYHNSGTTGTPTQQKDTNIGYSQSYFRDRYKKSIDPGFHTVSTAAPMSQNLYVEPEIYNQSRIAIRFTLQDPSGQTSYWTYDQEQVEALTRKNTELEKTLKSLTEEAVKDFKRYYRDDLRKWEKKNKH